MSQKNYPSYANTTYRMEQTMRFPGYSAIGRLRGLTEIRGVEFGVLRSLMEK